MVSLDESMIKLLLYSQKRGVETTFSLLGCSNIFMKERLETFYSPMNIILKSQVPQSSSNKEEEGSSLY